MVLGVPRSGRYRRPSPSDRVARVRPASDAHAAHRGQPTGAQDSHQDGQQARQAHCTEGREEMPDVMPGAGPGREERPGKEHGDLASDEAHQADQGPASVDEPEPHAIYEQKCQGHERRQPGEVPRPLEDVRHPKEAHPHTPAAGGPLDDLQYGEGQAVDRSECDGEADRPEVVGAAADAEGEPERH